MLLAGDELGRTQNGNNNAYCQDNEISLARLDRDAGSERAARASCSALIALRRAHRPSAGATSSTASRCDGSGVKDVVLAQARRRRDDRRTSGTTTTRAASACSSRGGEHRASAAARGEPLQRRRLPAALQRAPRERVDSAVRFASSGSLAGRRRHRARRAAGQARDRFGRRRRAISAAGPLASCVLQAPRGPA